MRGNSLIAVVVCSLSTLAFAEPAELVGDLDASWQSQTIDGIRVRSREVTKGTFEVVAEGEIEATVQDVEDVIRRVEHYPRFMPYVKEARVLAKKGATTRSYQRVGFAFMFQPRDSITELVVMQSSRKGETFRAVWTSRPDALPEIEGVLRVKTNEGEWTAQGIAPHKTQITYRFIVSPEGTVPSFVQDFARREAAFKVFGAIEQEANDRAFTRSAYSRIKTARRNPVR